MSLNLSNRLESSLDWANEDGDEVSGVLTNGEVALVSPVSLDSGDVGGDGLLVESVVLGDLGGESGGRLEDLGPGLDGGDVVAHALAWGDVLLEVEDEGLELLDGAEDVEGFEVGQGGLEEAVERGDAGVAGLHLLEVVVSDHAVDETGSELGKHQEVELQVVGGGLDGANGNSEEIGGSLAGGKVLLLSPVALDHVDVVHDLGVVADHVLGDGLNKGAWGSKDGSPGLNGLEVITHTLTSGKSGGELTDELLGSHDGLDVGARLEVGDESLDIGDNTLGVGDTGRDLSQVVVANEANNETFNELKLGLDAEVDGLGGSDGANSEGKSISGVLTGIKVGTGRPVSLLLSEVSLDLGTVEEPVLGDG